MKKIFILLAAFFLAVTTFIGCTPSQFKKGVELDEDYPKDVLGIYEDAIVFESEARFGKVIVSLGTEDELDDIVEYFRDYYEYMGISAKEELDDDEYSSEFTVQGYEFELNVEEASGDAKDHFEYVIEITSKKLEDVSETQSSESSQAEAASSDDPAQQSNDSPSVQATEPPQQKRVIDGENALTSASFGAWYSYTVFDSQKNDKYVDYTIWFADGTTGSYHYFDYSSKEKMDNEFTYEIVNGVLVLNLDNNVQILYDAYFDNGQMHLINQYTDEEMYLKNWQKESNKTPNIGEFTAYGSWITYLEGYAEPVCLALWEDGAGYIYNWNNDAASDNLMWEKAEGGIKFDVGTLYGDTLTVSHRGNILLATTQSGDVMYFKRATTNVLSGVYELSMSNDGEVSKWTATLYPDQNATHKISSGRLTFNYDNSNWYVNPIDGLLYAFIFGEYESFYYYYNESQLILSQPADNLDYTFDKTGN